MILTTIQKMDRYVSVNPRFAAAFAAARALAEKTFAGGRHEVDGEELFINAAEYDTKPAAQSLMEAHRRYIDVMVMLEGEETIGIQNVNTVAVTKPYDESGDALLGALEPGYAAIHMQPGSVAILLPEDAHAPGMDYAGTHHVRKLICKVREGK